MGGTVDFDCVLLCSGVVSPLCKDSDGGGKIGIEGGGIGIVDMGSTEGEDGGIGTGIVDMGSTEGEDGGIEGDIIIGFRLSWGFDDFFLVTVFAMILLFVGSISNMSIYV